MTSPAAEARAKVKSAHPEAVVSSRGRNFIKHRLDDAPDGRKRFALDVAIGPLHYGPDNDQEIDTALVPSTAPWDWEMTKAGFEVRALSDLSAGQVVEYRNGSEWVRFQPHALQYSNDLDQIQPISMPGAVGAVVADDTLTWTEGYGPGLDFSWQVQTARLMKLLTINAPTDLPAVDQFILDGGTPVLELNLIFAHSSGVTPYVNGQEWKRGDRDTQGLVEFRDGQGNILWWFNLPRSWDSEGNDQLGTFRFKKQGSSLLVTHRVPLDFIQNSSYPLRIDVTVDEQVGHGDDDAFESGSDASFSSSAVSIQRSDNTLGFLSGLGGDRFQTVAIGNADTIDTAKLTVDIIDTGSDDASVTIEGEDVDDAVSFVTNADVFNRVRTTAAVTWQADGLGAGTEDSPEIKTVIQELVNRGGWATGQDMCIITVPLATAARTFKTTSYEGDTSLATKLHVEFTAAAAGVTVTPPTATLTLATFIPVIKLAVIPPKLTLTLATFTPIVGLSVIPPPLALSLAAFAPTVTATEDQLITPPTLALSLAAFAPVIQLGVIPPTRALSLSAFAPVIGLAVVPPTITLSLSTFAPTATVTENVIVTPGVVALSLTAFELVIQLGVVPPTLALSLSAFAPVAVVTGDVVSTPPTLALSLATFVPAVVISTVIAPLTLVLSISGFAPVVILGTTPVIPTLGLSLIAFVPIILLPVTVTPPTTAVILTTLVPTVLVGGAVVVVVTPDILSLTLAVFAPAVISSTYTSYGPPFLYTEASWGATLEFFLEVYFKAVAGTVRARLYNAIDGVVAASTINTTSTSYVRLRSSALSLTDGRVYFVQFGTEEAANGAFKGAKIIAI